MSFQAEYKCVHTHLNWKNWIQSTGSLSSQYITKTRWKGNQTHPKNCWKHIVLRPSSRHDSTSGAQHNHHQPNKGHKTNDGTMYTTTRLPGNQSKCKGEISCIGYGVKHTFGRIIHIRIGSTKSRVWTFFHGMDAQKWGTNQVERSILHKFIHNEICRSFSGRSRTRRTIPQLPNIVTTLLQWE